MLDTAGVVPHSPHGDVLRITVQPHEGIQAIYEENALPAHSFARAVAFAMSQPEAMDVNQILDRPTSQVL